MRKVMTVSLPGFLKQCSWLISTIALLVLVACGKDPEPVKTGPTAVTWTKPAHFPEPVYDLSKNPMTEEGIELGRFLFYDGILSRSNQIGCGTCHQQQAGFTHHGHQLSHGVDDLLGIRNSLAIQNLAWNKEFFWDGVIHGLDSVSFNPITNPVEMDETVENVLVKLRNTPLATAKMPVNYPKMFKDAFGTEEITSERMMKALSQFMLTLVSSNSKYDLYLKGQDNALNATEKQGLTLFQKNCSGCHSGALVTDFSFRNNGLTPAKFNDTGRYGITKNAADMYKFKVPSLRNLELTAPYMHDGRFYSLEEVLAHYANYVYSSPTLDPLLQGTNGKNGIALTQSEQDAIIAFLKTLTDLEFMQEAKFADPGVGTAF